MEGNAGLVAGRRIVGRTVVGAGASGAGAGDAGVDGVAAGHGEPRFGVWARGLGMTGWRWKGWMAQGRREEGAAALRGRWMSHRCSPLRPLQPGSPTRKWEAPPAALGRRGYRGSRPETGKGARCSAHSGARLPGVAAKCSDWKPLQRRRGAAATGGGGGDLMPHASSLMPHPFPAPHTSPATRRKLPLHTRSRLASE